MSKRPNKTPKGRKGLRRKLLDETLIANAMAKKAMFTASKAIDNLLAENVELKRLIIAERAQVIYYTEMALGYSKRTVVDPVLKGYSQLPEKDRQKYLEQSVREMSAPQQAEVPHKPILLTDADSATPKRVQ